MYLVKVCVYSQNSYNIYSINNHMYLVKVAMLHIGQLTGPVKISRVAI